MPRGRKPDGEHVRSNAERQARHRAKQRVLHSAPPPVAVRVRRVAPPDRRTRPQRWRDAVNELVTLQAEYAEWLATLPDSLQGSSTAEVLEAVADLDLTAIADVELPRGYGRD